MIHIMDKNKFQLYKNDLDGLVFWRELSDDTIEIKIAMPKYEKYIKEIIKNK